MTGATPAPAAGSNRPVGRRLMAELDALARFSDDPAALTRLYLSPAHAGAADWVAARMARAGLTVRRDALGTVIGRREGTVANAPALLLGSHIDTVRDGGRYDGALGVLGALAAVDLLGDTPLPFAVEVLAFGEEEGVRFPVSLTSSRAIAGILDPATLAAVDGAGVSLREALRAFGTDPAAIAAAAIPPAAALAYVEIHIEQGPVLEAAGEALGVVSAITGVGRFEVRIAGGAGHAGTTPMAGRRDALVGAAEMILAVERIAVERGLVATVGQAEVANGAVNVIAGQVRLSLDLRSPDDAARRAGAAAMTAAFTAIAARRGLSIDIRETVDEPATPADPAIADQLAAAIAAVEGGTPRHLFSGAGHDGIAMAALCPIGMMFVRCRGGISHSPLESITVEDADRAVAALAAFIRGFVPPTRKSEDQSL